MRLEASGNRAASTPEKGAGRRYVSRTAATNTANDAGMQASVISKSTWQNSSPHATHSTDDAAPPIAATARSGSPAGTTRKERVVTDTAMAAAKTNAGESGVRRWGRKAKKSSPNAESTKETLRESVPRALPGAKMPSENHDPYTQAIKRPRPK